MFLWTSFYKAIDIKKHWQGHENYFIMTNNIKDVQESDKRCTGVRQKMYRNQEKDVQELEKRD